MSAKEILQRAYVLHYEIMVKREQISILQSSITNMTVSFDHECISKSPDYTAMQSAIIRLLELKDEVNADVSRLTSIAQESIHLINQVDNVKVRAVLSKHYLGYKTWQDIADEMNISVKWALHLHSKGLHQLDQILASGTVLG